MKQDQYKTERDIAELRQKLSFFTPGIGAPQFTPPGRAIYLRLDGGTNTTLYVYEGTAWIAK